MWEPSTNKTVQEEHMWSISSFLNGNENSKCKRHWNGWEVLYADQPLERQQGGSWQCSLSRYWRERERERREWERKPLMTHEDGLFLKNKKNTCTDSKRNTILGVLLITGFFFIFFYEMHQNESAVATNEWVWLFGSVRKVLYHWVLKVMVCFVFFRALSSYKSSKWQHPSTYIVVFTFYLMLYFTSALDLVVEMLQVVIIYAIGPKYIPGIFEDMRFIHILKSRTKTYWLSLDPPLWRFWFLFDNFTA